MARYEVSFLDVSNVYAQLHLTDAQIQKVDEQGFQNVSYGDAFATLIGNRYAWECIQSALFEDFTPEEMKQLREKYWNVVGVDDYINLEN
jgi:hypothetical protein